MSVNPLSGNVSKYKMNVALWDYKYTSIVLNYPEWRSNVELHSITQLFKCKLVKIVTNRIIISF